MSMAAPGDEPVRLHKWGRAWRIGGDADIEWIRDTTGPGLAITSAIPPVYEDYATVVVPEQNHDLLVVQHLRQRTRNQKWWLGFLDTGASDMVFPEAPRVELYSSWSYVLVLAGPAEALAWRNVPGSDFHGRGPDLIFPTDRSWLLSWLWDDDWYCLGGPRDLVDSFVTRTDVEARRVSTTEDATPPGHTAY